MLSVDTDNSAGWLTKSRGSFFFFPAQLYLQVNRYVQVLHASHSEALAAKNHPPRAQVTLKHCRLLSNNYCKRFSTAKPCSCRAPPTANYHLTQCKAQSTAKYSTLQIHPPQSTAQCKVIPPTSNFSQDGGTVPQLISLSTSLLEA